MDDVAGAQFLARKRGLLGYVVVLRDVVEKVAGFLAAFLVFGKGFRSRPSRTDTPAFFGTFRSQQNT